jgi:hypothetical protein
VNKIKKTIEDTNESILISAPWRETTQWLFTLHESWQLALDKGVKIRWITEKQVAPCLTNEVTRTLIKNPNFILKRDAMSVKARFAIYDDKEVSIIILSATDTRGAPALWSNNPAMVSILKDYFETKWELTADCYIDNLIR